MRNIFCRSLVSAADDPSLVFLTGDLGFNALEPLREVLGTRFINAGVAEQNMISVAAGLARSGLRPWVYSIAPFIYARPFEQIRNDLCQHNLPVVMVGNGGGYGYGVMGATHHALEDYGTLLCLPNLQAFVPAFRVDIPGVIAAMLRLQGPGYLRLGLGEDPADFEPPAFAPWRRLLAGRGAVAVVVGPMAGGLVEALRPLDADRRASLWTIGQLPIRQIPEEFLAELREAKHLCVIEEHVAQGGVGSMLARELLLRGEPPRRFTHRPALGYPSGTYGSQKFHRRECGLDVASLVSLLTVER